MGAYPAFKIVMGNGGGNNDSPTPPPSWKEVVIIIAICLFVLGCIFVPILLWGCER